MSQQREARLVNEWLWLNYNTKPQWHRVRLGPAFDKETARMYKVLLRWADAVVLNDNEILIIEAKMTPEPGAISQLEFYAQEFKHTPEFSDYWDFPQRLIFLTTREDEALHALASEKNIEYVVFRPDWVNAYDIIRYRLPPLPGE